MQDRFSDRDNEPNGSRYIMRAPATFWYVTLNAAMVPTTINSGPDSKAKSLRFNPPGRSAGLCGVP